MNTLFKSFLTIISLMLFGSAVSAQNISVSDTLTGWDQSWVASLNGSQAAYNNWSQGGVSSISGTGSSVFSLKYRNGLFSYGFRKNLKYGQSNTRGQGVRKTDDVIQIINRFNYLFRENGDLSGYGAINFRSQFDQGFEYDAETEAGTRNIIISNFLAPAYITEGVGIAYNPGEAFTFEGGFALKQTIVTEEDLKPVYGIDQNKNIRGEGGFTTGINFEKEIFQNIQYTSTLETFTNFLTPINETDVLWGNELVGQINSLVSAAFQFEMRYDNDFSSEVQVKQVLSAGISVNLY